MTRFNSLATVALSALAACSSDFPYTTVEAAPPASNQIAEPKIQQPALQEVGIVKGTIHDQICGKAEDAWKTAMSSDPCELQGVDALGETMSKSEKFMQSIEELIQTKLKKDGTKITVNKPLSNDEDDLPIFKVITIQTDEERIIFEYNGSHLYVGLFPNGDFKRKSLTISSNGKVQEAVFEDFGLDGDYKKFGPEEPCDGEIGLDYIYLNWGDDFSPKSAFAGHNKQFFTYGDETLTCDTPAMVRNVCETGEAIRIKCEAVFDGGELGYDLKTEVPITPEAAEKAVGKLWFTYGELLKKYGLSALKP